VSVFPRGPMPMVIVAVVALTGCASAADFGAPRATGRDPVGFPECRSESYDFAGEGTLAGLGLDTATPVRPPNPDQPAMIWVTHELKPWDHGEPGGPVEMTRMLCFEFADGSGGSEWPVDATWQPPGLASSDVPSASPGTFGPLAIAAALAVLLVAGASFVAFRKGQS
jgi:hypothetical protein